MDGSNIAFTKGKVSLAARKREGTYEVLPDSLRLPVQSNLQISNQCSDLEVRVGHLSPVQCTDDSNTESSLHQSACESDYS